MDRDSASAGRRRQDEKMDRIHHSRTPSSKRRSISEDSRRALAPSPTFNETNFHTNNPALSKDDDHVPTASPQTPTRPDFLSRGLSLQMPPRTMSMSMTMAAPNRVPLSPQVDTLTSYASPATSLPRHSRGLDFSRACTNLHHSTLAEQSSPDSSPVITQKGMAITIPSRKASISSMMLDSPNLGPNSNWPQIGLNDRSTLSSSVGSVNMLGSESDSDSDGADLMDDDDPIYATPHVRRLNNRSSVTPFAQHTASPGSMWSNNFSPAHASLMKNFQRGRFKKGRSRTSSSSASGTSAMPSPRTTSPPPLRSIESSSNGNSHGYFPYPRLGNTMRESLALGNDSLNISSGNDSGDEAVPAAPSTPGVVRRAVTRRGNMLPKTKGFARIRAALMEESMPVDAEVKREADTLRQVRERDTDDLDHHTTPLSPGHLPVVPGGSDALENIPEDTAMGMDANGGNGRGGPNMSFNIHASRNSAGLNYWNKFDKDLRTPPPPSFPGRGSFSLGGDINMDSPAAGDATTRSASVVSMSDEPNQGQQHGDFPRKFGKRRRDDDFDIASIKRRAVSPSLSVHNSPAVTVSPARSELNSSSREGTTVWGQPPNKGGMMTRESSMAMGGALEPVRSNSGGSQASMTMTSTFGPPKRVGLQGMVDTNDGIMKMSIE